MTQTPKPTPRNPIPTPAALAGPCFYQTPALRAAAPDASLPGELVSVSAGEVAIRKPDGKYLTVLYDGTDQDLDQILDQETFILERNAEASSKLVLTANRMSYAEQMKDRGGARCYWIAVLLA